MQRPGTPAPSRPRRRSSNACRRPLPPGVQTEQGPRSAAPAGAARGRHDDRGCGRPCRPRCLAHDAWLALARQRVAQAPVVNAQAVVGLLLRADIAPVICCPSRPAVPQAIARARRSVSEAMVSPVPTVAAHTELAPRGAGTAGYGPAGPARDGRCRRAAGLHHAHRHTARHWWPIRHSICGELRAISPAHGLVAHVQLHLAGGWPAPLSMVLPSMSTTSKRQPSHCTVSVTPGSFPVSSIIVPLSVWARPRSSCGTVASCRRS